MTLRLTPSGIALATLSSLGATPLHSETPDWTQVDCMTAMQPDTALFPDVLLDLVFTATGDALQLDPCLVLRPVAERTASLPICLEQPHDGETWIGKASFDTRGEETTPLKVRFTSVSSGGLPFRNPDLDPASRAAVPATTSPSAADPAEVSAALEAARAIDLF
ncbi:hypothetical protein [Ostreiculturibacter nitratireducens]|uniref:hypothetical protein n=1 Tax=Ostreiculturibacter nitratireducens TaxID=3075226 RepID=UPI0031B5BF5F